MIIVKKTRIVSEKLALVEEKRIPVARFGGVGTQAVGNQGVRIEEVGEMQGGGGSAQQGIADLAGFVVEAGDTEGRQVREVVFPKGLVVLGIKGSTFWNPYTSVAGAGGKDILVIVKSPFDIPGAYAQFEVAKSYF